MPGRPRRQGSGSGRSGSVRLVSGRSGSGHGDHDDPADVPADPESVARIICLRLLTAAPRTRAQLADALERRGVPSDAAETVLARFTEVGLIDDATFAAAWVESRHHGRGLGRRTLAAELDRRGVARDDIDAAMDRLSPDTERATALALVERRVAATAGQPYPVRVRKLAGLLARKGYSAGVAFSVVREVLARAEPDRAGMMSDDDDWLAFELAGAEEPEQDRLDD